ncbi:MAG: S16 family serine protease [bacterium]
MFNKIYEKLKNFIIENYKFIVFLIFLAFFLNFKMDYVIYTPGGYISLNNRIEVEDGVDPLGSFNMAYVSMVYGTPATVLLSYFVPNWDIEKVEDITLDNQSLEELEIYQKLSMRSSEDLATVVAYKYAEEELSNVYSNLNIMYLDQNSNTDLVVGDTIVEVNGVRSPTINNILELLEGKEAGDEIKLTVLRDDKEVETTSVLFEKDDSVLIGISFVMTYDFDTEREISFKTKSGESGPSGGFMMTLAIYNQLVEEDLTNGKKIVGTGTIDLFGNVGVIDGVKYKILGSTDADIFFCPVENYEEAIEVVDQFDLDIEVVKVETFYEAVEYLQNNK